MIPFGKWLPDGPRTMGVPHLREAKNVMPVHGGYGPARQIAVLSQALGSRPFGATAARDTEGNVHVYAGLATELRELANDTSWTNRSRSMGGAYATPTTGCWRFAPFEDDIIAVNFADDVQTKDMTTTNNFGALSGSPPKAADVAVFEDFAVLGRLGDDYNGIAWSAAGSITGWTPGTGLSDRRSFPDGGFVQRIVGTDVLRVFQQRAIRRGVFVGPPKVIEFVRLEVEHGVLEPRSLCQFGRRVFYLADNGFQMIIDGEPISIGEMVDNWFFNDVNQSYIYRMSAAVNPDGHTVHWSYPSTQSPSGTPDTEIVYHIIEEKFTYKRYAADPVFNALTLGYTLEGLDTLTTDIDDFEISFDDPLLQGGSLRFSGFDSSFKLGVFTGNALEGVLETGHFEPVKGRRAKVRGFRPLIGNSDVTCALGTRERLANEPAYSDAVELQDSGRAGVMASGRYFSAKLTVPAGSSWDDQDPATGIDDIEAQPLGSR